MLCGDVNSTEELKIYKFQFFSYITYFEAMARCLELNWRFQEIKGKSLV